MKKKKFTKKFTKRFTWSDYNKARKNNPPRDTLVFALKKFSDEKKSLRSAFDIGCGPGNDTVELLKHGWKVNSTDSNSDVLNYLNPLQKKYPGKLSIQIASFEDIKWRKTDLVNASYTLAFCDQQHFNDLWKNIVSSIRSGGRFSGQLFGKKDEWENILRHSKQFVKSLFKDFEFEYFSEVEKYDRVSNGSLMNSHIFNVVARKR